MARTKSLTAQIHEIGGISQPYASQIATGARAPSLKMAFAIYDNIGMAFGPLKGKSARQIAAMRRAAETLGAA